MNSYSEDFYAWTQEQAKALICSDFIKLDISNLAEEILSLGRSEKRRLKSLLVILFLHLLKKQYQPTKASRSWDLSIIYSKKDIIECIQENPSLKPMLQELSNEAYKRARDEATIETGLPTQLFPKESIWDIELLLKD